MMKTKTCLFVGFAAVMSAVTSCKEANLFDEEDYKAYVASVFPVQNIDPLRLTSIIGVSFGS